MTFIVVFLICLLSIVGIYVIARVITSAYFRSKADFLMKYLKHQENKQ